MTKRPIETYITPQTDKEWPADHPLRRIVEVAPPGKMAKAEVLICRRASDPLPPDVDVVTEYPGTCRDCGQAIIRRNPLPNPTVELICVYCWHDMKLRAAGVPFFACPECQMRSSNPNDVKNRYCGKCHKFFADEGV